MAANGSFDERIEFLMEQVGDGDLSAVVTVDQPYAQDQHETPYRHTQGQMRYLGEPLLENALKLVAQIAPDVITEDGSNIKGAMIDVAEDIAAFVPERAPKDTGRLRESHSASVVDDGREVYNRPALAPRENDQLPRMGGR